MDLKHILNITSLDKLQITKVKDWKVHFTYDGTKYCLIDISDDDRCIALFKIEYNEITKRYFNEIIGSKITTHTPKDSIKYIGKGEVYSQIDKEHFVKKLVELGFSDGLYKFEYVAYLNEVCKLNKEIKELQDKLGSLRKDWSHTSGHGSKTSSLDRAFKVKHAESIVGHKDGEWCEKCHDYYGNTHPIYGGVLTDLRNLPVGTEFLCMNGSWVGKIGYDNKGHKTVIIGKDEKTLTEEVHALYILRREESWGRS